MGYCCNRPDYDFFFEASGWTRKVVELCSVSLMNLPSQSLGNSSSIGTMETQPKGFISEPDQQGC